MADSFPVDTTKVENQRGDAGGACAARKPGTADNDLERKRMVELDTHRGNFATCPSRPSGPRHGLGESHG